MTDITLPDAPEIDESWPNDPIEIPGRDDEAEGFGAVRPMTFLTPIAGGKQVDPRTLKGSFFFMDVEQKKRPGAKGDPYALGSFNALAYDPL